MNRTFVIAVNDSAGDREATVRRMARNGTSASGVRGGTGPPMFRHQGPGRTDAENRLLAGILACVGGFANSAGFVLVGTFTSHVTGNVGRFGNDVAAGHLADGATALSMVVAFFAGAFVASMILESAFFGPKANGYAVALVLEAALFALFVATTEVDALSSTRARPVLLCAAMGMQNSLVTRLSGAVVRTTHLTGVVTDLGIEGARWLRWWRGSLGRSIGRTLAFGDNPPEKPSGAKTALLATIALTFTVGATAGAATAIHFARLVMLVPLLALVMCAGYALASARHARDENARNSRV